MVAHDESLLSTQQCIQALRGLIGEVNEDPSKLQRVHYEVVHMIQALQQREDVNLGDVAALEYQYLPLLEYQAETVALNRVINDSPELFVHIICDTFTPKDGPKETITDERKTRARLGYQVLQSIKTIPGFSGSSQDIDHLRSWISQVRKLATDADRAAITDQQIGQILAYAPRDAVDGAWPTRGIRELIEELASEDVEIGITVSRFNQRGVFTKALYDGGAQERGFASQYREWASAAREYPRTTVLLERIADDWDRQVRRADTEARLDQIGDI